MSNIENASINPIANTYFDGKCVSHSITLADGSSISAGVIFPSSLTFNTGSPERMQLLQGKCRVRLPGSDDWQDFSGGQAFDVAGDSSFDIEVSEDLHYICHFG
jgi:uncharacterized protein YaiE (UPF0345 family)